MTCCQLVLEWSRLGRRVVVGGRGVVVGWSWGGRGVVVGRVVRQSWDCFRLVEHLVGFLVAVLSHAGASGGTSIGKSPNQLQTDQNLSKMGRVVPKTLNPAQKA